jgi:hypothetical protein
MKTGDILSRLKGVRSTGDHKWEAQCPAHDDQNPSLTISQGEDGRTLICCHSGCTTEQICQAIDIQVCDLFDRKPQRKNARGRIVETYDYTNENGKVLFQCVRYSPKRFKQRRPDPDHPGEWIWNLDGVPRVLYRLPELKAAIAAGRTIQIAEGEKDCDALTRHGFAATCNPMGAGKWRPEHTKALEGANQVVVIADRDEAGRKHALAVAHVIHGVAKIVKLIELPDRDGKSVKDAADWLAAGGTADELRSIVDSAREIEPASEPQPPGSDVAQGEDFDGEAGTDGDEESDNKKRSIKSAATQLVKFAQEFAFFHDPQNRAFVRLEVNGHTEVWSVNSTQFRHLLAQTYWKRARKAINRNALADAITTLAGLACFDSPEAPVFLRVAWHREDILVDLCDAKWRVIEVTAEGWRVLEKSPVAFIRTGAMSGLPLPDRSMPPSLDPLWKILNVTPDQRPLVAGAFLNHFHPHGPFFVINFVGEQGTGKSCAAKIMRMLIDPNETPLRSPPREERDLLVQAASNWCVALDNLSALKPWLSDGICRLSTGGGHSARALYTDAEEFTLSVKRPVILNGIEDVATRPDLAERALQIELATIPDDRRIPERELWQNFAEAWPVIFAALLRGLVCALRDSPNVKCDSLPRMADAAIWATAGETAFGWPQGTFLSAYYRNLDESALASLDANPVGVAVRQLLDRQSQWVGDASQLLKALSDLAPDELKQRKAWPKLPRVLSACLRRLAPAFRRAGFNLEFNRDKNRRTIRLCKATNFASPASPASPESSTGGTGDANDANSQPFHDESGQSGQPDLI